MRSDKFPHLEEGDTDPRSLFGQGATRLTRRLERQVDMMMDGIFFPLTEQFGISAIPQDGDMNDEDMEKLRHINHTMYNLILEMLLRKAKA